MRRVALEPVDKNIPDVPAVLRKQSHAAGSLCDGVLFQSMQEEDASMAITMELELSLNLKNLGDIPVLAGR